MDRTVAVCRGRWGWSRPRPPSGSASGSGTRSRVISGMPGSSSSLPTSPSPGFRWPPLPSEASGKYLIHDYAFAIIPTPARLPELLAAPRADRRAEKGETLLLVGDIDYNAPTGNGLMAADRRPDPIAARSDRVSKYEPLANAASKLQGVKEQFLGGAFPGASVETLTGAKASKEVYLRVAPLHRWRPRGHSRFLRHDPNAG